MNSTIEQIRAFLEDRGEPRYRQDQVIKAWYSASSWEEVTTLPKQLKADLAESFEWMAFSDVRVFSSKKDETQKAIMTLSDGNKIESVYMPNARGSRTVCISSQVGCGMACTFCATGTMGLMRNLTIDEIVDQIRYWQIHGDEPVRNIVFMGMGEPLANYDAVKQAARIFIDEYEIGSTRITVSTVGPAAGLQKVLQDDDFPPVRLAISIHAGTDETRKSIVPSHGKRTMNDFVQWVERYIDKRGNRRHHVTLEYVMLEGVNDMPEEAEALGELFSHMTHAIKVNLIPWNPTGKHLETSSDSRIIQFQHILQQYNITTTIRYSKGLDIDAACGQLVVKDAK